MVTGFNLLKKLKKNCYKFTMEQWPSERVPKGGVFHSTKIQYNPERKKFLQELINESRLDTNFRQKLNYTLRTENPSATSPEKRNNQKKPSVIIKSGLSKRRQFQTIYESGAYNPDKYVPVQKGYDREQAKQHLQDMMTYGTELKKNVPNGTKTVISKPDTKTANRFDELKQEIEEREQWLSDMEKLGEGYKYKILIEQQIAARIREMKALKVQSEELSII